MIKYLLLSFFTVVCVNCHNESKPKFIIDNDAGGDDAMAIFLAMLYEKNFDGPQLIALTTGNGNTDEDNVCFNNQRIRKIAKREDIPIYRGSKKSLVTTEVVVNYYGLDGLGDSEDPVTDLLPVRDESAVSALIDYSKKYEGNLSVVTIGTLTNVALAMTLDPDFLGRLQHLYIGAGHIHSELYPEPEFNARVDVEAYRIVVQNATPDKVTIVPFSQVKQYLNYTKDWRLNVLGAIKTDIIKNQNKFEKVSLSKDVHWHTLDPAVVALFLRPELVKEYKYSINNINVCGDKRGITTNEFVEKENANVRVAYSVKKDAYKQFLIDVFASDAEKTVDVATYADEYFGNNKNNNL